MTAKFLEYPNGYPPFEDDELMLGSNGSNLKLPNLRATDFDED